VLGVKFTQMINAQ